MRLDEFLYDLHFAIDKVCPPDWEVEWEDAPLPYKLYRHLPSFPLSLEVPLTLETWEKPAMPTLGKIGHFLWYVYGNTQFAETALNEKGTEHEYACMYSSRRFVPSGGALYPNELYLYLKIKELPEGVYHYDVAHHRLVLLREGNYDSYIARALGNRCDLSSCFGVIFVSTIFWKNFFKYHYFSYRLQGLDAGVLLGQLLETAKRFGYAAGVYFQFLDRALNHLLGLSDKEESIYAVVPLSVEATVWFLRKKGREGMETAAALSRELNAIRHEQYGISEKMKPFPLLVKMNQAAMLDSTALFRKLSIRENKLLTDEAISLPNVKGVSYDLAAASRRRYSADMDFVIDNVHLEQLAALVKETMTAYPYRNDLDETVCAHPSRVFLYGCFHRVEGITDGSYYYDSTEQRLKRIKQGDHRYRLQSGMASGNINLFQVPLCFHIAGSLDYDKKELGYRGYRIQQMEAGMLLQRLLLAAAALGMGSHPLLGFDVKVCDTLYSLTEQGKTSLIQIPIGPVRARPWLQGSILC